MKRSMTFAMLFLTFATLTGCHSNDDEIDVTPVAAHYELTITNATEDDVEIYFKNAADEADFERRGVISPGELIGISNLIVWQNYVVRAAPLGSSAEGYFYEELVHRTSPTDVALTVTD